MVFLLSKIKRKVFSIKMKLAKFGVRGSIKILSKRILKSSSIVEHPSTGLIDVFSHYSFITQEPFGHRNQLEEDNHRRTVNWVIPDFNIGSGGHINIFRFVDGLEHHGYKCNIIIVGPCQFNLGDEAKKCIDKNFRPLEAQVFIGVDNMPPAWISIATSWDTAYTVRAFKSTVIKCYFVQDFEPYFYAQSSEFRWAEETYKFGFYGITAGAWLAQKLSLEYDMKTSYIGFSYDRELYAPLINSLPSPQKSRQIFFYARSVTPRRGFELGLLVLKAVSEKFPDVEFILAGWDTSSYDVPFKHTSLGIVQLKDLYKIYGRCYAALVLSFTNLSLLPLELMACGCPVVSNYGANVEWLLDKQNAVLAEPNIESLSSALISLLENPQKREQLSNDGLRFARSTDWVAESTKFSKIIDGIIDD